VNSDDTVSWLVFGGRWAGISMPIWQPWSTQLH